MFKNLFKKVAPVQVEQKEVVVMEKPKTGYPKVVDEIHNEFETAAENLAIEAKQIIAEAKNKDVEKVTRLINLGFKQSNQVSEVKPLIEKAKLSEEQVKLLNEYARKYPLNKFITEGQVEVICKKYSLVCGEVGIYKGFVPEKNLREIEKFNLKSEDFSYVFQYAENSPELNEQQAKEYAERNLGGWRPRMFTSTSHMDGFSVVERKQGAFHICAPIKDMDTNGLELKEGYKLEKKHVPDPVVLQPVNGGYLIITKWGDEASDPLLTNPIEN